MKIEKCKMNGEVVLSSKIGETNSGSNLLYTA